MILADLFKALTLGENIAILGDYARATCAYWQGLTGCLQELEESVWIMIDIVFLDITNIVYPRHHVYSANELGVIVAALL